MVGFKDKAVLLAEVNGELARAVARELMAASGEGSHDVESRRRPEISEAQLKRLELGGAELALPGRFGPAGGLELRAGPADVDLPSPLAPFTLRVNGIMAVMDAVGRS